VTQPTTGILVRTDQLMKKKQLKKKYYHYDNTYLQVAVNRSPGKSPFQCPGPKLARMARTKR
jgi:hypothetical protein